MASGTLVSLADAAKNGMNDPRLLGEWLAVAWSREVEPELAVPRRLMGRDIVLWRSSESIHCWRDLCIHRGARLSLGIVRGDCLICPYHAWEYDAQRPVCAYPGASQTKASGQGAC